MNVKMTLTNNHKDAILKASLLFELLIEGDFKSAINMIHKNINKKLIDSVNDELKILLNKHYLKMEFGVYDYIMNLINNDQYLSERELGLIRSFCECYSRFSIGQFQYAYEEVFRDNIMLSGYSTFRDISSITDKLNINYGIHSKDVDDNARICFDVVQAIRHMNFLLNSHINSLRHTVDSSINLCSAKERTMIEFEFEM